VALASKPGMQQLVLRGELEPALGAAQLVQVRDVGRSCGCEVVRMLGSVWDVAKYVCPAMSSDV
jgi:hypothetical protein